MAQRNVRGLTAKELLGISNRQIIRSIVDGQVDVIDAEIKRSHAAGFSRITHDLPTNFNLNNMSLADAQTLIYSELILIYSEQPPSGKGFEEVIIKSSATRPQLIIGWTNGMADEERTQRTEIIRAATIVPKKQ